MGAFFTGTGKRAAAILLTAALIGVFTSGVPALACATGHLGVRWTGFPPEIGDLGPLFFYHAPEASAGTALKIRAVGDDCSQLRQPVTATYRVSDPPPGTPRSAHSVGPPPDYRSTSGTTPPLWDHNGGQQEETIQVTIFQDLLVEPVAEQVRAVITSSTGRVEVPWDVPLYLVDDDGTDRVSFESAGPYERSETYGSISVPVFRAGPAASAGTFSLTAAGSSANPATPGEDHGQIPGAVSFEAGERVKFITIPIVNDKMYEPPEELTLTLTDPGTVLPDDPVSVTVRILDGVGASGLESRLHHPKQRFTYRASDYRIREVHIFTIAGQGSPVISAQLAVRKNMKGGKCQWLAGKRFKRGDCQNERWLGTGQYEPDFFYKRLKELRPTKGKIRSYTAFSRAINATGEVEPFFENGRNQNTFKVKPAKKR